MSGKLQNKVAVITGATSGIGLAAARLFVEEGAYVFIMGRRQKQLDEAVNSIGREVVGVQGDVTNLADLDRLYETVETRKGRVDIVFANAGVGEAALLEHVTEAQYHKQFDTNVKGVLLRCKRPCPCSTREVRSFSRARPPVPRGRQQAAFTAPRRRPFAALRVWTDELKDRRIRANVISPGPTETPLFIENVPRDVRAKLAAATPMGRLGRHGRFKIVLRPALAVPGWCDVALCRDLVSVLGS